MILKNLSFIHSCNFDLTDFLKQQNFHYDLVLFKRRPQNKKKMKLLSKNHCSLHRNAFSQNVALISSESKSRGSKLQFLRNSFTPAEREGEDTMNFHHYLVMFHKKTRAN